jgi:hypothetical protein
MILGKVVEQSRYHEQSRVELKRFIAGVFGLGVTFFYISFPIVLAPVHNTLLSTHHGVSLEVNMRTTHADLTPVLTP